MTLENFEEKLQIYLVEELDFWQPKFGNLVIKSFDLGVHPWHGYFEFSFLTKDEITKYGEAFRYDIGDWKYYNFNDFQENTQKPIHDLGLWMQNYYEKKKTRNGELFFEICAKLITNPKILEKFERYNLTDDFELTVYNPDDSTFQNYCLKK